MGFNHITESYLLKCPNCEELSLDGFTGKCSKCGNIQPSNDFLLKNKVIKVVEEIIGKEYIGKINLILDKKNIFLKVYLVKEKLIINNLEAMIQLKIGEIYYNFYLNYNIKVEHTGDYNEEGVRCLSRVFFSKIERFEDYIWKDYKIKNNLNKKRIKQFIVMEILNNKKYNKYL